MGPGWQCDQAARAVRPRPHGARRTWCYGGATRRGVVRADAEERGAGIPRPGRLALGSAFCRGGHPQGARISRDGARGTWLRCPRSVRQWPVAAARGGRGVAARDIHRQRCLLGRAAPATTGCRRPPRRRRRARPRRICRVDGRRRHGLRDWLVAREGPRRRHRLRGRHAAAGHLVRRRLGQGASGAVVRPSAARGRRRLRDVLRVVSKGLRVRRQPCGARDPQAVGRFSWGLADELAPGNRRDAHTVDVCRQASLAGRAAGRIAEVETPALRRVHERDGAAHPGRRTTWADCAVVARRSNFPCLVGHMRSRYHRQRHRPVL
mmetsp:Transcript_93161/g.268088  ORF Transcript_93161/g.268088 Transcript_93161/m.268088 type:complete len:322 (-) Transcript_93161:168-1133(-)